MKILIVDNNHIEIEELSLMLNSLHECTKIDEAHHLDSASEYYSNNHYDYIFVNYDFTDGKIFSNYVMKHDKKQSLVAISALFDCNDRFDCKFCKESKNRFKMMKPITYNDVIKVITHQKHLEKRYCDDNYLLLKLKKIAKAYNNFSLDTYTHTIINKNSYLKREENLLHITKELHNSNIAFEVDHLKNIKLK